MSRSKKVTRLEANLERIWQVFSPEVLAAVCAAPEDSFPHAFNLERVDVSDEATRWDADWYAFRDNGADILAVAHLDTVADAKSRQARFLETESGLVVFSRALDDRLGAYTILDMLPRLGITTDILLTVGEESACSTAEFFDPGEKEYKWVIEFDRGGRDVVMYQYDDDDTRALVKESGARVGEGSFSDIAYLEHLGVKCFNWGVGYQDYHSDRSHAFLDDTFEMVSYFLDFYGLNADTYLPHVSKPSSWGGLRRYDWGSMGKATEDLNVDWSEYEGDEDLWSEERLHRDAYRSWWRDAQAQ